MRSIYAKLLVVLSNVFGLRSETDNDPKGGKTAAPVDTVHVRFVLLRARLYSFDWA